MVSTKCNFTASTYIISVKLTKVFFQINRKQAINIILTFKNLMGINIVLVEILFLITAVLLNVYYIAHRSQQ